MSDRNFFKLLGGSGADRQQLPDVEVGVVKVKSGFSVLAVQRALRAELPPNISVLTRSQLKEQEVESQKKLSPVGPIFAAGTLVGFAVGTLITYQNSYFRAFRPAAAIRNPKRHGGYQTSYLVKLVAASDVLCAARHIPAWIITTLLFALIFEFIPVPIHMSLALTATTLVLTIAMCATAGLISIRRVVSTDPAEVL